MPQLHTCLSCHGFLPPAATRCPHCANLVTRKTSRLARMGRHLLAAVSGGAVMMTLMACYGMAHRYPPMGPPSAHCEDSGFDYDRDGVCTPADCDDGDPTIAPGASDEIGDDVDSNCDGVDGVKREDNAIATPPAPTSNSAPPTVTPQAAPTSGPDADGPPERAPLPMVAPAGPQLRL